MLSIPDRTPRDQAECLGILTGTKAVREMTDHDILAALNNPFQSNESDETLFDRIRPNEKICIVVSDHTRQTAVDRVLPVLVRELTGERRKKAACRIEDMFILIASGIHRHPNTEEVRGILGTEVANAFEGRVFVHDPDDVLNLVHIGTTRRGHPVRINRRAAEADRLILTGAASYHYHAGFGGGRKSLIPGLADRETIAYTHSLTLDPVEDKISAGCAPGVLDGNPVSEAIYEGASFNPPDFIINTVLTESRLAGVFAGGMDAAHRAACRMVEKLSGLNLTELADFVIADAGSASNWIQSHKALFNANRSIRADGRIILIAPCIEGLGDERFRYWITRNSPKEIYVGLRQNPEILGQTALSTRMLGEKTILITGMRRRDRQDLDIRTATDLNSALRMVFNDLGRAGIRRPKYYLMPDARETVPFFA